MLPDELFEAEYMTAYHSGLDTSEVSADSLDEDEGNNTDEEMREAARRMWEEKVHKAKEAHYSRMARKANIPITEQLNGAPVWERRAKAFRSQKVSVLFPTYCNCTTLTKNKYNEIIMDLDRFAIRLARKRGRGHVRPTVPKVDFGTVDERPPSGKGRMYPFMLDPVWLASYEEEHDNLDVESTDPAGFENSQA